MRRVQGLLAVVALAGVVLTGCGDDGAPAITGTPAPTSPADATTTSATQPEDEDATLTIVSTTLGEVVADRDGRTLYVFTDDRPNTSTCTGTCLTTWPRYAVQEAVAVTGISPDLVDTISVDGVQQATIDGMPLYYYAGDAEPGDVNGQGVGGKWFAVRAGGDPVS